MMDFWLSKFRAPNDEDVARLRKKYKVELGVRLTKIKNLSQDMLPKEKIEEQLFNIMLTGPGPSQFRNNRDPDALRAWCQKRLEEATARQDKGDVLAWESHISNLVTLQHYRTNVSKLLNQLLSFLRSRKDPLVQPSTFSNTVVSPNRPVSDILNTAKSPNMLS